MTLDLILTLLLALAALPIAQESGLTLEASAGFDRLYKESAVVPIIVNARNDGPPVEGEIRVILSDSNSPVYTAPISLPTQSDKRVPLYVRIPAFSRGITVELVSDDRRVATTSINAPTLVSRDDLLYGVVSSNPGALAYLETITGGRAGADVAFLDTADLPDISPAWSALDILILDDTDTGRLTSAQLTALRTWVENGGQLVVTGGPGGLSTAGGVADLLPVAVRGIETVDDLPALSDFAGAPLVDQGPFILTGSTLRDGDSIIHQDNLPILARKDLGLGSVYFLALDPKLAPLLGWPGNEVLWDSIAGQVPDSPPWGYGIQDGFSASQVAVSIPGLRLPSTAQLMAFLLIYIAIIGPINFFILKRLNRRELAWITIPALVLLFSGLTYFTSFRTRGSSAMVVEMAAAHGAIDAERINTETIIGLYSPRRDLFDLMLPYDSVASPLVQSFGTLLGAGNLEAIERESELILRDIRTDTGEVATFLANADLPGPALTATARLVDDGRALEVTVRYDGESVFEDAVLIVAQDQFALGNIQPGEERTQQVPLPGGDTTSEVPNPLFSTGVAIPNPLVNDPSYILGTSNYFNDPEVYPRWQLLQSLYYNPSSGISYLPEPTKAITLAGWMAVSELPVDLNTDNLQRTETTLYLLEIPVR
jgi:hypothetical protein